jgi:O-antigen ligase/tetratricopeptide (TPR) repeat protein
VTVQRIRALEDVERLLGWVAYAVVGMGVFGLIQYVTSNGKFFWVYQDPFAMTEDGAKGAFTNRNHFAHFLALGLGPVIWWVQDGMRCLGASYDTGFRTRAVRNRAASLDMGLRLTGLVGVFLAILMSLSRGGGLTAGVAALVSVAVCYRAGAVRGKFAIGLTAVALLLGGFLLVGNENTMGGRLEELASGSIEEIDNAEGRRIIWKTTLKATADFARLGSGVGSFREVYPLYLECRPGYTFYTHAENGYLQVALETGIPGLVLVILAIMTGGFWAGRGLFRANSPRAFVAAGAVAAALLASAVHSCVDFVWYTPGCLIPALILAACACRISQFTHDEERRQADRFVLPRPIAWLTTPVVVATGMWMVTSQLEPLRAGPHWTTYQRLQRAAFLNPPTVDVPKETRFFPEGPREVAAREEDARQQVMIAELEKERAMVTELVEAVRHDPNNAQAQLALAGGYLRLFQFAQEKAVNRMPLSMIRDAAIAAGYSSRVELEEWLSRAVGEHYRYLKLSLDHAKAAVALCPLQGEGYLYLGELCFLEVDHKAQTWDFVEQALRVRPYNGTVLFHAGREAWLAGRNDEGLDFWLKSYDAGPIYQRQVIDWTAGRIPLEFILSHFQPNLEVLKYMQSRYQSIAEPAQLTPLLEALAQAAQAQAQVELDGGRAEGAAECWLNAMSAYQGMLRFEDAAACGRHAVECNPHSFDARYRLGFLLSETGRFAEADEHLAWCSRAKPGHIKLKRRLTDVKRMLLDPEGTDSRRFGSFRPPGSEFMETSLQVAAPAATAPELFGRNNIPAQARATPPRRTIDSSYPDYSQNPKYEASNPRHIQSLKHEGSKPALQEPSRW